MTTLAEVSLIVDCEHKTAPIDPDGEYFAVGTPAMRGNSIDYSQARRIDQATFETWTRRLRPQVGDLLFAREAPVGLVVRIPDEGNIAPGQRTVLIRPDNDCVDPRFLFYIMASPVIQRRVELVSAGSTVAHMNVSDVRELDLGDLPNRTIQASIADVLGALDDKIAANRRIVVDALALGEALFDAEATDESVSLARLAEVTMGLSPKGTELNTGGVGMVFYQGVRDFGEVYPSARVSTSAPTRTAEAGDALLAVRAPVGRVNLAVEETCLGRGVAGIRAYRLPATLYFALRVAESGWDIYQDTGTVFSSVTKEQVRTFQIRRARETEAERLEAKLAALLDRGVAAERESEVLARTRDELLPLLMDGRITVRQAEEQAMEAGR
ncbi:restriction endonuclease subunit S [Gordonia sp. (in: high G+C Gram-positive bacteria)]|uniref:restriction endonuclease subunit S n=1 Tax=Gordonia sp. (in: high G+C Gram-positive bacteria) TaxID=84139 RepID=UPI0035295E17